MFPDIPEEIVKALEEMYHDRCPDIHESERQIFMNAGAVSVVRFLRSEFDRQNKPEDLDEEEDFINVYIST